MIHPSRIAAADRDVHEGLRLGPAAIDPVRRAETPLLATTPGDISSDERDSFPQARHEPPLRVWLLTNVPSPYQVELLSAVAVRPEISLAVRYMRESNNADNKGDGSPGKILLGLGLRSWRDEFRLHPGAVYECLFGRHDCYILSGSMNSVTFLACTLALRLRGAAWGVWIERPRPRRAAWRSGWLVRGPLRWLRNRHVRQVLSSARRVIGIGLAAVEEYAEGVAPGRLGCLPYCCDVSRYAPIGREAREESRQRLGLAGQVVFLFSGRLIERKGVDTLLRAFRKVAMDNPATTLVILGDGQLREELRASVPAELNGRVVFRGHLPQADLPDHFRTADIFVFPSRHDGWGVVVNEACGAGLPVIASRQTGAARDLVIDGINGFRIDCEDADGFAARMAQLARDPEIRLEFGAKSRELVERFSVANGALTFVDEMRALSSDQRPIAASQESEPAGS